MKKKFTLLMMLCFIGITSAWAEDVTLTFNSSEGLTALGIQVPTHDAGKSGETVISGNTYSLSGVSFKATKGTNDARIWITSEDVLDLRVYNGSTMTLSVAADKVITNIAIASSSGLSASSGSFTTEVGTYSQSSKSAASWTGSSQSVVFSTAATQKMNTITVTVADKPALNKPTITPGTGTYATGDAQTLTMTADEGASIYYTIDGTTPTNTSTLYNGESKPVVASTTTVKAIAYKDTKYSDVTTATYTFVAPLSTVDAIQSACTDEEKDVFIQFDNWYVSAIKDNNAWFTNGTKGFLLYTSGHGFKAGDKVQGLAHGKLINYKGNYEIQNIKASDLTVTANQEVPVITDKALNEITQANQGSIITLTGLKFDESNSKFTKDADEIAYYDKLGINPTNLSDGQTYTITGILGMNKTDGDSFLQIYPRSAEEIVCTSLTTPETSFENADEFQLSTAGTYTNTTFSTTSTGEVTYTSSDVTVATVTNAGVVTILKGGKTTITANTAQNSAYLASSASYTLHITTGDGTKENPYNAADVIALDNKKTGNAWVEDVIAGSWKSRAEVADPVVNSNIVIGIAGGYVPVELKSNTDFRAGLNVKDNPGNVGKTVILNGNLTAYQSGSTGVKDLVDFNLSNVTAFTITSEGYATYYTDKTWKVPTGIRAAIVKKGTTKAIDICYNYEAGDVVPSKTAVLLEGAAGTYNIDCTHSGETATGNLLKGTLTDDDMTTSDNAGDKFYRLSSHEGVVGFYWGAADGAAFKPGANKAYLPLSASEAKEIGEGFAFDDETTGICAVDNSQRKMQNTQLYNLQGVRVNDSYKGIVIVNGKKILNK